MSSVSLRPVRPSQFPTPRRLRSLRPDQAHMDSPLQQMPHSPSIQSDDGSARLGWMLPYGEPLSNGVGSGGHERGEEGSNGDTLNRSFLRMSRMCLLNDQEGNPTVMAVAGGVLAVGTREGRVGLFDRIKGWTGAVSVEGVITALAISSDKTFLAVGSSIGHIYLYDVARLSTPARHVVPVAPQAVATGRSEGHLKGSKILHLAFVGIRHTAVVSADECGLSFYHSLGKILGVSSNDTLRILGRYPDMPDEIRTKKQSVLAMATLPLGPVQHAADIHHFVALLTPSKMVLVGLKPTARTWYRQLSPDRDSQAVSGCLAWIPSTMAAQVSSATSHTGLIQPTLAYSFGRELQFIRLVSTGPNGGQVTVVEEKRWKWSHPSVIEAIQWLSPDFIVLYADAAMSLFDVRVGRCTEEQATVRPVSNTWIDEGQVDGAKTIVPSSVGSLKAHKGSLFILTPTEVVASSLISWADRILALVSTGNFLGAIELATSLLQDQGTGAGSRVGLPESFADQKPILSSRLLELMRASTTYAFSEDRMKDDMVNQRGGIDRTPLFEGLARVCAQACIALHDFSFLFDELFDIYSEAGIEAIFADQMETFIVSGQVRQLPIAVVQRLIIVRKRQGRFDLAERIIWNVDPTCLDLDQTISLCLEQGLHDALIYVYTTALHDFVGPIVELMPLIKAHDGDAYRIMSYLSISLIGLSYPNRQRLDEGQANLARSSLYAFLFSGRCVIWPLGAGGKLILTRDESEDDFAEPTFPYLSLLLDFDAEAFLDALDVALEDTWLDEGEMTRQEIVSILFDMVYSQQHGHVFIAIFLARNAPKFPQFIHLGPAQVETLLATLSVPLDQEDESETREDRQFAVECLLSAYRPAHTSDMLKRFELAGFVDILQRVYRSEGKWDKLAKMIVAGPPSQTSLDRVEEALRKSRKDAKVQTIVLQALPTLVDVDVKQCVSMVQKHMAARQVEAIRQLDRSPHRQLAYLSALLEMPDRKLANEDDECATRSLYIALVCSLEPQALVKALDARGQGYFDLQHVIEVTKGEGVMDGLLWARDRLSQTEQGLQEMEQYVAERHLVLRISNDADESVPSVGLEEEAGEAMEQIRTVVEMAVRICSERGEVHLWVQLLKAVIQLTHDTRDCPAFSFSRTLLEDTLSSFVSSSTAERTSFSSLFEQLVADGQGSTYAEVRTISDGMMAANMLRQELLSITNRLFDRDVHQELAQLVQQQRIGWRPASGHTVCSGCNLPCIGERRSAGRKRNRTSAPARIRSPFLEPLVSPRPDKGKGVVRESDEHRGNENGEEDDFFAAARSAHSSSPIDVFSVTPTHPPDEAVTSLQPGVDSRHSRDSSQQVDDEDDDEGPDGLEGGVLVCTNGEMWHRRCAPHYMLESP